MQTTTETANRARATTARAAPRAAGVSASVQGFAQAADWKLWRGDAVALLGQLPAGRFELVVADPPYFLSNGGYTCKAGRRVPVEKGAWDVSGGMEADLAFTYAWLKGCRRVLSEEGSLWVSGTQHNIFMVGFVLQQLGYRLLNTITWYKPNASPNLSCRYFTHSTELLLWAAPVAKGKQRHIFNYGLMKQLNGNKQMRDVWALPKTGEEELSAEGEGKLWSFTRPSKEEKRFGAHPTQKPLALMKRIVEAASSAGAWVLDPFCGSGTTGVAALETGRRFVGIDADEASLELARRRLSAARLGGTAATPPTEPTPPAPRCLADAPPGKGTPTEPTPPPRYLPDTPPGKGTPPAPMATGPRCLADAPPGKGTPTEPTAGPRSESDTCLADACASARPAKTSTTRTARCRRAPSQKGLGGARGLA